MRERTCVGVSAPVPASRAERSWGLLVLVVGAIVVLSEPLAIRAVTSGGPSALWLEVREQTTCEAMQDDYCLGRYGFAVRYDGSFIAGPSGQGSTIEGRIKPQERQRLRKLVGQVSSSLSSESKTCRTEGLPGIKDQVDITLTDGVVVRVYDLGGRVGTACYVGRWERVRDLHKHLHELMAQYYPVPFPTH